MLLQLSHVFQISSNSQQYCLEMHIGNSISEINWFTIALQFPNDRKPAIPPTLTKHQVSYPPAINHFLMIR